jgi:hypothetical protein
MRIVTQTRLRLLSDMFVNLAAGWLGLVLVAPGIWGVYLDEAVFSLTKNIPLAILSLMLAEQLVERSERI